ncbi:hypothetical protein [uncultured Tateyamaria sp.]|uniref:hypothetical protein n=1 Tax=Tateyamaria sp. 1078 TaxID=3417464 RepID=UPI00263571D3|nr:hypothetical protein [uncultured Tateyamaria sp.]
MTPKHLRLVLVGAGLAFVAACGGGGSSVSGIATLGSTFQQAFAQGPNDAAIDVANADLVLQLTQDPFEL